MSVSVQYEHHTILFNLIISVSNIVNTSLSRNDLNQKHYFGICDSCWVYFITLSSITTCISVCLNTEDCASECCCLVTPPGVQATVLMGTYSINWKRSALHIVHTCFRSNTCHSKTCLKAKSKYLIQTSDIIVEKVLGMKCHMSAQQCHFPIQL